MRFLKPQQTNLFREQGKSCITPPTTTFKKEEEPRDEAQLPVPLKYHVREMTPQERINNRGGSLLRHSSCSCR